MKHYQILVKGVASNQLTLFETTKYSHYKKMLNNFENYELIKVITTNMYIK